MAKVRQRYPRPGREMRSVHQRLTDEAETRRANTVRRERSRDVQATTFVAVGDEVIRVRTTTSPTIDLILPTAVAALNRVYTIKDVDGNAATSTITVKPVGGETINGATSLSIATAYQSVNLRSDGQNWLTE